MKARSTWLSVVAALAVVLVVLAWVSASLLRLDAEHIRSQRQAVVEEQARLALWRMDSAMSPILSREVAGLEVARHAQLPAPPRGVELRFELVAGQGLRALTQADPAALARLEASLVYEELRAELERLDADAPSALAAPPDTPYAFQTQALRNDGEWSRRKASADDNLIAYGSLTRSIATGNAGLGEIGDGRGEGFDAWGGAQALTVPRALWVGDQLLLVRRGGSEGRAWLEGSWIDWPTLRSLLLEEVGDLLPQAQLMPVPEPSATDTQHMLASLPVRLEPGATIAPLATWSPLRVSVVAAWVITLLACAALLVWVRASAQLSERRATFVSAVTHELRTPLTTFRMYTEMLGEGMVEHKRARYIATLRREADRLSALVENVLAYAQIESEQPMRETEASSAGALIDGVEARLRERCEAAEMELELELGERERGASLLVDPAAVEQILFNLVDNAAKYASTPGPARVCLSLELRARKLAFHVRDFGPGVAAREHGRIFEPFTKAEADAAGTKPGVGLGLALSRRLARQMGGELSVSNAEPGSDFVLTLPRAR